MMTEKQRLLLICAIDSVLFEELNYTECFTKEERNDLTKKAEDIFDMSSPKELREGFIELARNLYSEGC